MQVYVVTLKALFNNFKKIVQIILIMVFTSFLSNPRTNSAVKELKIIKVGTKIFNPKPRLLETTSTKKVKIVSPNKPPSPKECGQAEVTGKQDAQTEIKAANIGKNTTLLKNV